MKLHGSSVRSVKALQPPKVRHNRRRVPPVIAMEEIQIRRSMRLDIAAGKRPVSLASC